MNYCNTSLSSLCAVNWRLNILTPSQTPHDHLSFYLVWRTLYGWRKTRRHPSPLLYQLLSLIGWITDPYEIEIQKLDNGKKRTLKYLGSSIRIYRSKTSIYRMNISLNNSSTQHYKAVIHAFQNYWNIVNDEL